MRLIVDTNRIIAALITGGITRQILLRCTFEFLVINMINKEVEKYSQVICEKARIDEEKFSITKAMILGNTIMIPDSRIQEFMEEAKKIMEHIDSDDTPFIAAALATNADIWSDDKHFKMQKRIKVWTTKELVERGIE